MRWLHIDLSMFGRSVTVTATLALAGRIQDGTPLYRVAERVVVSPVGTAALVQSSYFEICGGAPTDQGVITALGLFERGVRLRQLNRDLLASNEYDELATTTSRSARPAPPLTRA